MVASPRHQLSRQPMQLQKQAAVAALCLGQQIPPCIGRGRVRLDSLGQAM